MHMCCVFYVTSLPKAQEDHSLIRALPAVIGKVQSALHAMLKLHERKITPQHKRRWINKVDLIWFLTLFLRFGKVWRRQIHYNRRRRLCEGIPRYNEVG